MNNIGIDFGTTNSIISFLDDDDKLKTFEKGAGVSSYIPSFISIDEEGEIDFGQHARAYIGDDDCLVFSKFKTSLGDEFFNEGENVDSQYTPYSVTKMYLKCLVNDYKESKLDGDELSSIVITVPELWLYSGEHTAREKLKRICDDLNFPLLSLISEPVAASAFYLHEIDRQNSGAFTGHILVCDYGGGTLDLSLVYINDDRSIDVLEGAGLSKVKGKPFGAAGVGYDKAVLRQLFNDESLDESISFDYEQIKLSCISKITKSIKKYLETGTSATAFKFKGEIVTSELLVNVYREYLEGDFIYQLNKISDSMVRHDVDNSNPNKFRILMAGGFSNFFLVQETINEFFGISSSDQRLDSIFDDMDKAFSISKGAALIANNLVTINNLCPITLGIKAIDTETDNFKYYPVIEYGVPIKQYEGYPKYCDTRFIVESSDALVETPIIFYVETPNDIDIVEYQLGESMREYLPNPHVSNKWEIGFSVDSNLIFTIHVRDETKEIEKFTLGDLVKKEPSPNIQQHSSHY